MSQRDTSSSLKLRATCVLWPMVGLETSDWGEPWGGQKDGQLALALFLTRSPFESDLRQRRAIDPLLWLPAGQPKAPSVIPSMDWQGGESHKDKSDRTVTGQIMLISKITKSFITYKHTQINQLEDTRTKQRQIRDFGNYLYVNVLHKDQGDKKWSFISSDHLSPTNQQSLLRKPLIYDTEHKNTCRIQRIRILNIYNRYILFREQALLYNMSYMTALRRCQEISLSHAIWRRIIAIKNKA